MAILAVLALAWGLTVLWWLPALYGKIGKLEAEKEELKEENEKLVSRYAPLEAIALDKFGGPLDVAVQKLAARLEELERKAGPRKLSEEQISQITNCLSDSPKGKVFVLASIVDTEAMLFAEQIDAVLTKSGFEVSRPGIGKDGKIPGDALLSVNQTGLRIAVKDPKSAPKFAVIIYRCFEKAGVPLLGALTGEDDVDRVEIIVGQKE